MIDAVKKKVTWPKNIKSAMKLGGWMGVGEGDEMIWKLVNSCEETF